MHHTGNLCPPWSGCRFSASLTTSRPPRPLLMSLVFSGVTRITVTVVTIAFELTGQGAYILPTMVCATTHQLNDCPCRLRACFPLKIVVMVTKSVGDWFGRGGIADQMIRFNGFPFLEKEDQPFNVPGESFPSLPSYVGSSVQLLTLRCSIPCDETRRGGLSRQRDEAGRTRSVILKTTPFVITVRGRNLTWPSSRCRSTAQRDPLSRISHRPQSQGLDPFGLRRSQGPSARHGSVRIPPPEPTNVAHAFGTFSKKGKCGTSRTFWIPIPYACLFARRRNPRKAMKASESPTFRKTLSSSVVSPPIPSLYCLLKSVVNSPGII
jgi:hypothetical protein